MILCQGCEGQEQALFVVYFKAPNGETYSASYGDNCIDRAEAKDTWFDTKVSEDVRSSYMIFEKSVGV